LFIYPIEYFVYILHSEKLNRYYTGALLPAGYADYYPLEKSCQHATLLQATVLVSMGRSLMQKPIWRLSDYAFGMAVLAAG
jgi:hypothetical protein